MLMYSLDTRRTGSAPPSASLLDAAFLDAALRQAARDADDVPGAYSRAPWGFDPATPEASALLDALVGRERSWIVVTCRRGDAGAHTRERCLTAVQRYLLSLAAEGVEATWIGEGLPQGLATASAVTAGEDLLGVLHMDPA